MTDLDRALLDFEKLHWKYTGAKESAIRDRFGMTTTRYYQLLNSLIDNPDALAAEPMLVRRLLRLRRQRQETRRGRGVG